MITDPSQVTVEWLSEILGEQVLRVEASARESSWAKGSALRAALVDGSEVALWLKICLGDTFGRSELDYYLQDYVDVPDLPLVRCYCGCFEEGTGYWLLLDDLSADYRDRKTVPPTLDHGLAVARALARLHAPYWESREPPSPDAWAKYFRHIKPGVAPTERASGIPLEARFNTHAEALVERWQDPRGMTLLHGDLNPTNVLTPNDCQEPVFFLDRQPFDWSLTYGLAVYDLAYATVPWWPFEFRRKSEEEILRCWHEGIGRSNYSWQQAREDWQLSVEHCLHVPMEWCREPDQVESMRWLWQWQLGNTLGVTF